MNKYIKSVLKNLRIVGLKRVCNGGLGPVEITSTIEYSCKDTIYYGQSALRMFKRDINKILKEDDDRHN